MSEAKEGSTFQCGVLEVQALPAAPFSTRVVVLPLTDATRPIRNNALDTPEENHPTCDTNVPKSALSASGDARPPYAPVSWAVDPYGYLLTDPTQTLAPTRVELHATSMTDAAKAAGSPPPLVSRQQPMRGSQISTRDDDASGVAGYPHLGGTATATTPVTTEAMRIRSWHHCALALHRCRRKEHRQIASRAGPQQQHQRGHDLSTEGARRPPAINTNSSGGGGSGTPSACAGTPAALVSPAPSVACFGASAPTAALSADAEAVLRGAKGITGSATTSQFETTQGSTALTTVARREERDWARNLLHHIRLRVRRERLSTAERGVAWPLLVGAAPFGTPAYDKLERYVAAVERIEGAGFPPSSTLPDDEFTLDPDAPSNTAKDSGRQTYNAPRLSAEMRDLIARDLSRTLPSHLLFQNTTTTNEKRQARQGGTPSALASIDGGSNCDLSCVGGGGGGGDVTLSPSVSGQGSPKASQLSPTSPAPVRSPTSTAACGEGDNSEAVPVMPPLPSTGQAHLRRVLYAVCAHDPEVGYCQGMGFIAATLLLHLPDTAASGVLLQLMHGSRYRLCDLYRTGFPLLQRMLAVLRKLLRYYTPRLSEHLSDLNVDVSFFASNWFLTLFAYQFPTELVARVWDLFFSEGWVVMFRVAMGLLIADEERLLQHDMEGLLTHLKSIHENRPPGEIVRLAMDVPIFESDLHYLAPPPPPPPPPEAAEQQQHQQQQQGQKSGGESCGCDGGALSAARLAAHTAAVESSSISGPASGSASTAASPLLMATAASGVTTGVCDIGESTNLLAASDKSPVASSAGRVTNPHNQLNSGGSRHPAGGDNSDAVSASGVTTASDISSAVSSQQPQQQSVAPSAGVAKSKHHHSVKFATNSNSATTGRPSAAPAALTPAQAQAQQAAAAADLVASVRKIQNSTAELRAAGLMREFGLLDDAGLTAAVPGVDAWMRLQGLLPAPAPPSGLTPSASYFTHFADCACATCLQQEAAGVRPRAVTPAALLSSSSPGGPGGEKSPSLFKRLFVMSAAEKERQRREQEQLAAADFEARQRASARAAVAFVFDPLREAASLGAFGPRGPPPPGVPAAVVGRFP